MYKPRLFRWLVDADFFCVQSLVNSEIAEITHKIEALDAIRAKLEEDLLRFQEDELELDDERASFHPAANV